METLNINLTELIEIYNHLPHVLERKAVKVSLQEQSLVQQNQHSIFLEGTKYGNYWVVGTEDDNYWLLPKVNFKIDSFKYDIIKSLFDCEGYSSDNSSRSILIQPAYISLVPANNLMWKLVKKGKLSFNQTATHTLETELKLVNQELEKTKFHLKQVIEKYKQSQLEIDKLNKQVDIERDLYQKQIQIVRQENQDLLKELQKQLDNRFLSIESQLSMIDKHLLDNLVKSQVPLQSPPTPSNISNKSPTQNTSLTSNTVIQNKPNNSTKTPNLTPPKLNQPNITTTEEPVFKPEPKKTVSIPSLPWISAYNDNPNYLAHYATEVAETEESINQRRLNESQPVVVEKVRKGNYWILSFNKTEFYLVPKGDLKVTEYNLKTIQTLFECRGDALKNHKFQLVKPAVVQPINTETWQVIELGILQF